MNQLGKRLRTRRRAMAAMAAGVGALALGSLGLLAAIQGAAPRGVVTRVPPPPPTDVASGAPAAASQAPTGTPTPSPTPTQPATPPDRISIPSIGVDAPVVALGVDERGAMLAPAGLDPVAWYNFSAKPGEGGNAVFSGHYGTPATGPAVFTKLEDLAPGDVIEVTSQSGAIHIYRVEANISYPLAGAPVEDIVGPSPREVVTLITCDGTFNPAAQDYSHRRVVRAARAK